MSVENIIILTITIVLSIFSAELSKAGSRLVKQSKDASESTKTIIKGFGRNKQTYDFMENKGMAILLTLQTILVSYLFLFLPFNKFFVLILVINFFFMNVVYTGYKVFSLMRRTFPKIWTTQHEVVKIHKRIKHLESSNDITLPKNLSPYFEDFDFPSDNKY